MTTPLHGAVDSDDVRAALAAGCVVDTRDEDGRTALMTAAQYGREHAVTALLGAGADVHARDGRGRTALHHAAEGDNFEIVVCALVAAGAELEATDQDGRTPLALAVAAGGLCVQDALVACGAAVDRLDPEAALLLVARRGDLDAVERLLARGVNPEPVNDEGYTPLMWAAVDDAPAAVLEALLRAGARPDTCNRRGETPLMRARRRPGVTRLLLAAGADPNATDSIGRTPLVNAVEKNDGDAVRLLLEAGADPRLRTGYARSLVETARQYHADSCLAQLLESGAASPRDLVDAAADGNLKELQAIVASGVDVNAFDDVGRSALVETVRRGPEENVACLLHAGADPFVLTPRMESAFGVSRHASAEVRQLLAEAAGRVPKSEPRVLLFASLVGHLDLLQRCLAAGADPDATDAHGEPSLMKAAVAGHLEVVRALIHAGARVDARDARLGATPLAIAAAQGHVAVVDLMLQSGADVNAAARGVQLEGQWLMAGETPLITAATRGHADVVERLLAAGADPRRQRQDGLDAAAVAAAHGHEALARRLSRAR